MEAILDLILEEIPEPNVEEEGAFLWQPALLDYNDFVGRIGIGVVKRGKIKVNDQVMCMRLDGTKKQFKVLKLFGYFGLKRTEVTEAEAGDRGYHRQLRRSYRGLCNHLRSCRRRGTQSR